eukprot:8682314-Pyramimonas_sp.AAC.1
MTDGKVEAAPARPSSPRLDSREVGDPGPRPESATHGDAPGQGAEQYPDSGQTCRNDVAQSANRTDGRSATPRAQRDPDGGPETRPTELAAAHRDPPLCEP